MFFSEFVLTKKGPLAKIWLAAHWDKKLMKHQIKETSITKSTEGIIESTIPIALRTLGHLLLGVVKIYSRKVKYVLAECNDSMTKMKLQAVKNPRVDLPEKSNVETLAKITLPDNITNIEISSLDIDTEILFDDEDLQKRMNALLEQSNRQNLWEVESTQSDSLRSSIFASPTSSTPLGSFGDSPGDPSRLSIVSNEGALMGTQTMMTETIDFGFDDELTQDIPKRRESEFVQSQHMEPIDMELDEGGGDMMDVDGPGAEEKVGEVEVEEKEAEDRTGKKRKRAAAVPTDRFWDQEVAMTKEQYRTQLKNTGDIIRRRKKAPRTREELTMADKTVDYSKHRLWRTALTQEQVDPAISRLYLSGVGEGRKKNENVLDLEIGRDEGSREEDDDMMQLDEGGGDMMALGEDEDLDLGKFQIDDGDEEARARRLTTQSVGDDNDMMLLDNEEGMDAIDEDPVSAEEEELLRKVENAFHGTGYSKKSIRFIGKLKHQFEDDSEVSLDEMVEEDGFTRDRATSTFFRVLELASKGMVKPHQEKPYGDITLTCSRPLRNVFRNISV